MLTKQNLQDIKRLAISIDHDAAFGGKSKGNNHLLRVVAIVEFIAKNMGADLQISIAGAFLHDTALPTGNDYNYETNKKIVKDILKSLYLSKDDLNQIAECVASHEGTAKAKSLEAKIVHDADVLEKTGILGIIRHTWKLVHSATEPSVSDIELSKLVFDHLVWRASRLQTALAQDICAYLVKNIDMSLENVQKIITFMRPLAEQDMITENIVEELRQVLAENEIQRLDEQLSLSYLNKFDSKVFV